MYNTTHKGSVRIIVFREGKTWNGIALEFNIVETGDNPQIVLFNIMEAVRGYVNSCKKANIRFHVLNQNTDVEYENLWNMLNKEKEKNKKTKSPYPVFFYGRQLVAR